ncbi:uncharacterized protein MYCFIDRAFT_172203 [Pseudocercospora fijiensis CIRAD86]|uniref:Uncharacterized protein n=1 Tax=Pseudocercospora fijiensis (strain CIRAD86) TaxID=383855 RepID=M2Z9F3_PSEFD|nr:uncharacterized protein MYCFIDRAFT_172203 [Pseudocercospora fijiensis CIRAD86]EME86455.1 hypothetical protein MYCFIDRAFT_172203 [Pseudocercospora fijiensis CIRAD86]
MRTREVVIDIWPSILSAEPAITRDKRYPYNAVIVPPRSPLRELADLIGISEMYLQSTELKTWRAVKDYPSSPNSALPAVELRCWFLIENVIMDGNSFGNQSRSIPCWPSPWQDKPARKAAEIPSRSVGETHADLVLCDNLWTLIFPDCIPWMVGRKLKACRILCGGAINYYYTGGFPLLTLGPRKTSGSMHPIKPASVDAH